MSEKFAISNCNINSLRLGYEGEMKSEPQYLAPWYKGSGKLQNKAAIITGGDSGIGRSVSILFAREGASVAIVYHKSHGDADHTKRMCEKENAVGKVLTIAADVSSQSECKRIVHEVVEKFGTVGTSTKANQFYIPLVPSYFIFILDILVNHAGRQEMAEDVREITETQLDATFRTNVYSMFFMTQECLNHMKAGSCIINTTSIVGFKGNPLLIDYTASKGATQSYTYALSNSLISKGIRVNAVAPGPIWTPFIPSTFPAEKVGKFGAETGIGRPGQPEEVAPAYVFLASHDSSYISGQTIHVNGGMVVGA